MSQEAPPIQPLNSTEKPAFQVRIDVLVNGNVTVTGFPAEYGQAMNVMQIAQRTVMDFFLSKAVRGEFKEQKIFMPTQGQVSKILKN